MMQQYHQAKARYPDAILFFQLGDFYETFFEDAELVARELDIVLTQRDGHPMAGVPVRRADVYLQRLLRRGYKVALCQQVERPGKGKGLLERRVVRVLTPGTVLEEEALDPSQDVYLAALVSEGGKVGVAWAEAASGEFYAAQVDLPELPHLLAGISVQEWLLPAEAPAPLELPGPKTTRPLSEFSATRLRGRFPGSLPQAELAARAAGAIVAYLEETVGDLHHLRPPVWRDATGAMVLDPFTQRSLELIAPLRPEGKLTLLSVLDRTKTPMGRRLLRRWLLSPLRDRAQIEARLDAVEALIQGARWEPLGRLLSRVCDLPRLLGRVGTGRLRPMNLVALRRTLQTLPEIQKELPEDSALLSSVLQALEVGPQGLAQEIDRALVDDPPPEPGEGGLIRPGYSPELDRLRGEAARLKEDIAALEEKERAKTGIPTLKVGYNRVLGYYLELTKAHVHKVPPHWRRRQSLAGGERYTTPELSSLAEDLLQVEGEICALEERIFQELCSRVGEALPALARVGEALATVDVLRSLAEVAHRNGYSRPRFTDRPCIRIRDGRHPVVERTVEFVPNDLFMDEGVNLAVVTGPNMAGKSVFLRQVALIALLAQVGSFVPAKEAELPVLDRIYARVGASDALAGGLSTFMAEMKEAAQILSGATDRSLVILDELGRGTSTHDGLALAWAIARHLAENIRCKTLFATHYRELARLAERVRGVINLHMAVREWKGEVIFLHRVQPGVAEQSYGVEVARLAQLPPKVLAEARRMLEELEKSVPIAQGHGQQLPLFGPEDHPVVAALRGINPEKLTPLEALELLFQLKEKAG